MSPRKPIAPFQDQLTLSRLLPEIAKMIDEEIKKAGLPPLSWALHTFHGGSGHYISNAERKDMQPVLQECMDRWPDPSAPLPKSFH